MEEKKTTVTTTIIPEPSKRYAILGSTGNCGTAVIQQLLRHHDIGISAYCRNRDKLLRLLPEVAHSKKVEIFAGDINDVGLLSRCVAGCQAVFLLASTNDNVPGCNISQTLAIGLIAALESLRAAHPITFVAPKLVLLSSATVDDHLSRHMPYFRPIMLRAASNVYEDLRRTETYLRAREDWLTTIYIKPGGLSIDIQRGHRLSLDDEETFLSYQDLAAGMLEAVGDTSGKWDLKNVGVVNANGKAKFAPGTPRCIVLGLVRHYFPFLHPYLPASGPA